MRKTSRGARGDSAKAKARPKAKAPSFLEKQKSQLTALRDHLVRRTDKVERDLGRQDDSNEIDSEEQATARENDDVLAALSEEGRDQLAHIDAALARIEAGTYGKCTRCDGPIARARLTARPYATTCVVCAGTGGS